MPHFQRNMLLAILATAGLALSPLAISHFDDKQVPQSYRQSWFAMLGANFGPMIGMVKGEIPWQENLMAAYADQLAALATLLAVVETAQAKMRVLRVPLLLGGGAAVGLLGLASWLLGVAA